jgi:Cu/Ag efflux protein CusF
MVSLFLVSAAAAIAADKPGGEATDLVVVTATVEKIDLETREVTLKGKDGKLETIKVGPEARNLDQLKVGDKVTFKYYQALAIFVSDPGEKPSMSEATNVQRAPLGAKPGGQVTNVVEAVATVEAVDPAMRTATIRGPRGNVHTMKVGDHVQLDRVKVGDQVTVRYTEALAVSVEKP